MPKLNQVPFPRGGRHFGDADNSNLSHSSTSQSIINPTHPPSENDEFDGHSDSAMLAAPRDKRKPLFGRFGKKKSRSEFVGPSGVGSSANPLPQGGSSSGALNGPFSYHSRKWSDGNDNRSAYSGGSGTGDDIILYGQRLQYNSHSASDERKRSGGALGGRKDRERSEGSLPTPTNRQNSNSKRKHTFDSYNTNFVTDSPKSNFNTISQYDSEYGISTIFGYQTAEHAETWVPPDSWGYHPPNVQNTKLDNGAPGNLLDDYGDYAQMDDQKYEVAKKNYCIRVFRQDGTFATLQVPLNTRASELVQKLASKFFMHDVSKLSLVIKRHKLQRVLQPQERPVQIQKKLLEQMGYAEEDNIENVGREDNSYLVRFIFGSISIPMKPDSWDQNDNQHIDLQARNLPTVPIFLYKCAPSIISLDVSNNMLMEIPVDFIQMCTNLKQLWLANNDYAVIPQSVRHVTNLEHLNISGNRLQNLQHAGLDQLTRLKTMRAFNNHLEDLPQSFQSLKHLTMIFIANNSFTEFPEVLCDIVSLTFIDISFNKISIFPERIGNLTKLSRLFAIANKFSGHLPPSFAKLENLQELDIRQNSITDLEVLSSLPKLEILFVDYNAVSIVNCSFKRLRQLKMSKNHLTQFSINSSKQADEDHIVTGIPYPIACNPEGSMLTDLNLSCCKLTSLPDELFLNMSCLEILILDTNALNTLPGSIGALQRLVRLSVRDNDLVCLPSEISKMSELRVLDVQNNNLNELPKEIWLCAALQTLNCSSNLLETFPKPYAAPGVALHLQLAPQADAVVTPTVVANAAEGVLPGQLGSHAGQGIVPDAGFRSGRVEPKMQYSDTFSSSQSGASHPPPNFNPPSFFASPRNHPPPLSLSLRHLYLGDNRLTNEIWSPLSLFLELRTLNLSFNDLDEIPPEGLRHEHLHELYLSGNHLTSLPADDLVKLSYLRILAVNGNKLQTLPAEIGKLRKLLVLDVGNNLLKYNIANWPYDWNWNWNLSLKYLNLSGNKRFEIKKTQPDPNFSREKNLSDFSTLTSLRMLGLMDVTILGVSVPEESPGKRVRTSPSEVNGMSYGIADWLGANDYLAIWDLVMPRVCNNDRECLFGLFDGRKSSRSSCKVTKYLNDHLTSMIIKELKQSKEGGSIVSAIRRTFLNLEKGLGAHIGDEKDCGASAVVCYFSGTKLYVANVGDTMAVISRNSGQASVVTQKHIPLNPSESSRIRAAGGFVSNTGLLNSELKVSRSFGYFDLVPVVNANPFVSAIELNEDDEFIIMASSELWEHMSYQTAVDVARTEKGDSMAAAQKLRDFALTYGANENLMVMVIGVGDLFDKRNKRLRYMRGPGRGGTSADAANALLDDTSLGAPGISKVKRRGKEEGPGDSTLARLDREVSPPINQVAVIFTDIKSSTLLWETRPESMRAAIKIHDAVMRRTLRSIGGYEVKTEGDAFMVCFQNITSALVWCFTIQLQLLEADWPAGILETEEGREIEVDGQVIYRGLSVRMGIHWGTPVFERNPITNRMDYFGPVVNKASRICSAADGGQICVSSDVLSALRNIPGALNDDKEAIDELAATSAGGYLIARDLQQLKRFGFCVMELGLRRLKGLETPEMLSLVYPKKLEKRMELISESIDQSSIPKSNPTSPRMTPAVGSLATSPRIEPAISQFPSRAPSPVEGTDDSFVEELSESMNSAAPSRVPTRPHIAPLPLEHRNTSATHTGPHIIDPALVCALHVLAVRLERLTTAQTLSRQTFKSNNNHLMLPAKPIASILSGNHGLLATEGVTVMNMIEEHIKSAASDEELLKLAENFVTRIENAVSALYLQKVGHFANILEKLGDAVELDPMHILRALQMYSEVVGLTEKPAGLAPSPPQ